MIVTGRMPMQCFACGHVGPARTYNASGMLAWVLFIILFILGFIFFPFSICWCISWIPLIMPQCVISRTICSRCGRTLSEYGI
ncbi:unnamed protein product, partial [Mesorhabditis belari]|uniref:LITAF domain-containing protein n=1 Tax=Mesorhabditis belari TaxID=2138241 RepID=A0AAF3FRQ2_9BILA